MQKGKKEKKKKKKTPSRRELLSLVMFVLGVDSLLTCWVSLPYLVFGGTGEAAPKVYLKTHDTHRA